MNISEASFFPRGKTYKSWATALQSIFSVSTHTQPTCIAHRLGLTEGHQPGKQTGAYFLCTKLCAQTQDHLPTSHPLPRLPRETGKFF